MTCHFGKCFWSLQTLKSGHWSLQVIYHLARATIVAELHEPRSTKYGLKVRRNEQYSCLYLQFHLYCISARKPLILEFSSICASIAQRQSTGLVNQGSWVQFSLEARVNDYCYFGWFESNERENFTFKWEHPTWRPCRMKTLDYATKLIVPAIFERNGLSTRFIDCIMFSFSGLQSAGCRWTEKSMSAASQNLNAWNYSWKAYQFPTAVVAVNG